LEFKRAKKPCFTAIFSGKFSKSLSLTTIVGVVGMRDMLTLELPDVIGIVQAAHPRAFFTVEELRSVAQGIFPTRPPTRQDALFGRKSK